MESKERAKRLKSGHAREFITLSRKHVAMWENIKLMATLVLALGLKTDSFVVTKILVPVP